MEPIRPRTSGPRKPIFATFYSFKGGVGRTMALLNAAAILAGRGRRVLMIDFDLEAPGLTLFQDRQFGEGASREHPGLVDGMLDALREFIDTPRKAALVEKDTTRFFETYVTSFPIPELVQKLEGGQLDLIPAGRLDDEYESYLYNLDFEELFEQGVGKPLFERFKAVIRDSGRYDYVLIDSRTGFSDEGSICTQYLGDYLVVVTGLNRQNIRGTARFLTRARVAERKQRLMLVASPVPMYYEQLRAERLGVAKQMLADAGLGDIRFTAQIPYHPLLALDEDPSVYSLAETDLFDAYEQIVETLHTWANDRPQERIQEAIGKLSDGNVEEGIAILQSVSKEEPRQVLQAITNIAGFLVDQMPKHAARVLEEGLLISQKLKDAHSEGRLLAAIGTAWQVAGGLHHAVEYLEQAVKLSQQLGDYYLEESSLGNLGIVYADLGEVSTAIEFYEQSLAISREIGYRSGEGTNLGNLGNVYVNLGEVSTAIEFYEQSLAISREIGDRNGEGIDLINLGNVYVNLGEVSTAIEFYEQSLAISREIGDQELKGFALGNLGCAYARLGHYDEVSLTFIKVQEIIGELELPIQASLHLDKAEANTLLGSEDALHKLEESWTFIMDHANAFERTQAHVLRARLLAKQEKYAEAAESAQTALTFYQERGVDSVWSREAEELLSKAQAHQG